MINEAGQMAGFAPLFPAPVLEGAPVEEPHNIWSVILTDPTTSDRKPVHNLLFEAVLLRAQEIKVDFAPRQVRLAADMMDCQRFDIERLVEKGFSVFQRVLAMQRSLADPVPNVTQPPDISYEASRLESNSKQQAYLEALNRCFPTNPKTNDGLQFQLNSPFWCKGINFVACDPQGDLVGSILVMVDEDTNRGILDDVFVLPEYRRRGIARRLVVDALRYLKGMAVSKAVLEVLESNIPAVSVYRSAGFTVAQQELHLGIIIG